MSPDWPLRRRAAAIVADLAELGACVPASLAFDPPASDGAVAGVLYVVEGSRLAVGAFVDSRDLVFVIVVTENVLPCSAHFAQDAATIIGLVAADALDCVGNGLFVGLRSVRYRSAIGNWVRNGRERSPGA